jgi:biopolymer transport protein ExbD
MEFRRKTRQPVDIGLIPMIDVLLVLLFFFMVATTFKHSSNLKINLPEASSEVQTHAKAINLFIDAKGVYALADENGKYLPLPSQDIAGLKATLQQLPDSARKLLLILNADGMTPHQFVISALDAANQQGFNQITFAINPLEKK